MATAVKQAPDRPFEHLLLDFLAYLEFERGLSRNTLEAYRSDLLQYGRFLEGRGLTAAAASGREIEDFLAGLGGSNGRAASPATIHRKAACLRSFYRHLRREGVLDTDPTAAVTAPRRGRKLPQVLTRGEVTKLLEQPKGTEPTDLRDRALLELMYACGLRASEAIGLDVSDVDIEEGIAAGARQGLEGTARAGGPHRRRRGPPLPGARPPRAGGRARGVAPVRELPRRGADPPGALQDRPSPRHRGGPARTG